MRKPMCVRRTATGRSPFFFVPELSDCVGPDFLQRCPRPPRSGVPMPPNDTRRPTAPSTCRILSMLTIGFMLLGCAPDAAIGPQNGPAPAEAKSSQQALPIGMPPPDARSTGDITGLRPSYDVCMDASHGETPAMRDCIDIEYRFQDRRLNEAYQARLEHSAGEDRTRLREAQRKWIARRDERCAFDAESGQAGALDAYVCRLDMTGHRAGALESP